MPVNLPLGGIAALVAIVIVGTLGAYMLYLQGVNDAGPVKASLLCCVEPVSAMILALAWLHTPVSVWDLAGCALIVVMILLVTEREPKAEPAAAGEIALADAYDDDPPLFAGRASVLGYYTSRPAEREDFERAAALLTWAGVFAELASTRAAARSTRRRAASCTASRTPRRTSSRTPTAPRPIALFAVSFSPDKNYERPIDGAWLTDTSAQPQPYAELHWVAVDYPARRRGVGMFILDKADQIARAGGRASIRADVYELNEPMQNLLEKHGYERCGTIVIKDVFGREKRRVGYERLLR